MTDAFERTLSMLFLEPARPVAESARAKRAEYASELERE